MANSNRKSSGQDLQHEHGKHDEEAQDPHRQQRTNLRQGTSEAHGGSVDPSSQYSSRTESEDSNPEYNQGVSDNYNRGEGYTGTGYRAAAPDRNQNQKDGDTDAE